ncbi:hypothetical protein PBRA_004017 [Plasmodiophora brassicae]|nr:hypothetical protein PBRA_004017 [Plasmodiophora brassicae]
MLDVGVLPQIDVKRIVRDASALQVHVQQRNASQVDFGRIAGLSREHDNMVRARQQLERQRNASTGGVAPASDLREQARVTKQKVQDLRALEHRVHHLLLEECAKVPNVSHVDSPVGDEANARVVKAFGQRREFPEGFRIRDHVELGAALDWFDFANAAAASGSHCVFLKNEAVFLEQALINWTLQEVVRKKFTALNPGSLVHAHALERCGFQPRSDDPSNAVYHIAGSTLCLSGTGEIPLAMTLYDKIIDPQSLPIRYVGVSPCFRTELSSGAASRGLYRLHQFNKVEMFAACELDDADAMHLEIARIQVELCEKLGLHGRLMEMPTEELGAAAHRKLDVEAWMPGRGRDSYGEIMSASNCTDYQSRRLNARIKLPSTPRRFIGTANGTACAVPRMIIAIMEQFQDEDGSVDIPPVLQPFMGGTTRVTPRTPVS